MRSPFMPFPSVYSPSTDSTVKEWVKADALALSDGASVSTWTASVGTNLTTTHSLSNPVFHTNIQNGLPAVRFPANSELGTASSVPATAQPFQLFIVFQSGSNSDHKLLRDDPDGVEVSVLSSHFSFYCGTSRNVVSSDLLWHILLLEGNGASSRYKIDGGTITTFASSPGADGMNGLDLGGVATLNDYIGEVIIRSGTGDPSSVFTYLNGRWAVY